MPIEGTINSLYLDYEQTKPLFPRTKTKAVSDENGVGLDATLSKIQNDLSNKATESFVTNEIAKAQLGGGSGEGNIDLSGFATKDDISILATKEELNAIDFPVDSVNGKIGTVQLSASDVGARPSDWMPTASDVGARPDTWTPTANDVGALPNTGGTLNGYIKFDGTSIGHEWKTADGTIFQLRPYTPGNILQFVTKTTDGKTIASLDVNNDGAVRVGNGTALRENIGAAPSGYGLGSGSTVKKVTDIVANGWYITNEETPTTAWYLCHAFVTNNGKDVTVEAWHLDGTAKWKRTKRGGIWGEWKTMCDAIGALPLSGGKVNGELWIGDNLSFKTDNEGGRIRVYPPNAAESGVDFWEIDSYNGKNLRIFADRNANHELGDGYGFALSLDADGSIRAGNSAKTRENLSVAPSGYGLGTESGKAVEFSKLDTAKAFGMWSLWNGGTINNISFAFAKLLVLPLDANAVTQMLFPVGLPGCVLTRDCLGGVWGPWECYNPPMQVGKEYRTTELYNGEAVYCITIPTGALPNTAEKRVPHGVSAKAIVRVEARAVHGTSGEYVSLPIIESSKSVSVYVVNANYIYIYASGDYSEWTSSYVTLYYTKN